MGLRGRGVTVLELAIVLVILGLLLAFALPYLTSRPMNLRADTNDLVANLRLARDLAISRTTHYRLRAVDCSSYVIEKGVLGPDGDAWEFREERRVSLRENVRFQGPPCGVSVEFDSRGRVVRLTSGGVFVLEDPSRGEQRTVAVSSVGGVSEP